MKTYKQSEHSIFFKPFGLRGRLYLSIAVVVGFDLLDPEKLITDQELWQIVPEVLKPTPILDEGMPKPHGEFLVAGSCFAPRGRKIQGAKVYARVGSVVKELYVFGNRYWRKSRLGIYEITDPEYFSEMPVTWENAFGGKEYPQNPVGKGIDPIIAKDGTELIPLPNVEYPGQLIASVKDRPVPAGFGYISVMHPERQKKTGTYDEKWLKERWPYFPDDINYEFFNIAPPDQFIDRFFKQGEPIEIRGMHPEHQIIVSHIPKIRIRLFVTKKESLKSDTEVFEEVKTHIDTLWLFPSVLKGVVIFRGTTEIHDEELDDVVRLFSATENSDEPPRSKEYYMEEQEKAANPAKTLIDMTPVKEAAQKIALALKRVKKLPKEMEQHVKAGIGKAPSVPRTPDEIMDLVQRSLQQNLNHIDSLEKMAKEMHAKWGHIVKIDLKVFDRVREQIKLQSKSIDEKFKLFKDAMKRAEESKSEHLNNTKGHLFRIIPTLPQDKQKIILKAIEDMESFDIQKPQSQKINPWHDRGFEIVVKAYKNFETDDEARKIFEKLGFDDHTLKKAWFGILHEPLKEDKRIWGLECKDEEREIIIPAGVVLPRFNENVLVRMLVIPSGWQDGIVKEQFLMEGSLEEELFILCEEGSPVVAVSDELQAHFMEQEIGDAFSIAVMPEPDCKLSKEAEREIKNARAFIIILPEKGTLKREEIQKWEKAFPEAHLYFLKKGRTVFEAHKSGIDLRAEIMQFMSEDFRKEHKVAPEIPEAGEFPTEEGLFVPIPKIDVKAMVEKFMNMINSHIDSKMSEAFKLLSAQQEKMKEILTQQGIKTDKLDDIFNFEKFKQIKPSGQSISFKEAGQMLIQRLNEQRSILQEKNLLTPEINQKIEQAMMEIKQISTQAQAHYEQAMAQLTPFRGFLGKEEGGLKGKVELPPEMKEQFQKAGIDVEKLLPKTRQEVIEMYQKGESLSQSNLSGLDLSGLDLRGADFTKAIINNTNFENAILDGAVFYFTAGTKVNFKGASLKGAKFEMMALSEADFEGADLRSLKIKNATLSKTNLKRANLSGCEIELSTFSECNLDSTKFENSRMKLSTLFKCEGEKPSFRGVSIERGMFIKCHFLKPDFSEAELPHTGFMECFAKEASFIKGKLKNTRFMKGSDFEASHFLDCNLSSASAFESNFSRSDFTAAVLDGMIAEKSDFSLCQLSKVQARKAKFNKCNFEASEMRRINLLMGSLRKSRLVRADLTEANLFGVDFYKTVFGETKINGANTRMTIIKQVSDYLREEKGIKEGEDDKR